MYNYYGAGERERESERRRDEGIRESLLDNNGASKYNGGGSVFVLPQPPMLPTLTGRMSSVVHPCRFVLFAHGMSL